MKRIFLIFLMFLWIFCADFAKAQSEISEMSTQDKRGEDTLPEADTGFSEDWEKLLPEEVGTLERVLIKLFKVGDDWQKQNPKLIEQADASQEINHPLSALYLMTYSEANPITGLDGLGQWQETSFGRMRLISCDTGLKKNKAVYMAVQMKIHPRLAMLKPEIVLKTPSKQHIVSYPIMYPLPEGWTRTRFYFEEALFPILFEPISYTEPLTVQVQVKWTVLNPFDNLKKTDTSTLDLTLKPDAVGETGLCGYMMMQLRSAPAPVKDNAIVQATVNEKGNIQLFFDLKKKTKVLSVQIDDDWTFEEVDKKINGKTAVLVIKPSKPIAEGTLVPIKLITSFGIFDVPTILQKGEFKTIVKDFNWMSLFAGGLLLFLATPLFSYFLLNMHRTAKQLEKSTNDILIALASIGIVWAFGWQAGFIPALSLVQLSPIMLWLIIGWVIYWIINPRLSLAGCLLMVIVLPKPYLNETASFADQYTWAALGMGLLWTAMVMWPFTWIKRYPKSFFAMHKLMKKEMIAILWFARLPAILLLIWLVVGGYVNAIINRDIEVYTPERVKQILAEDKIAFVSIEKPVCFSCVLNKAVALKTGLAGSMRKEGKLVVLQLSEDTAEAKQLMQRLGELSVPVNIIFGPKNTSGIVVSDWLHNRNTDKYLNAVR